MKRSFLKLLPIFVGLVFSTPDPQVGDILTNNTQVLLSASTIHPNTTLTRTIYGCCPDAFEGWCASSNKSGEWFQIHFLAPAVITELHLYPPNNGNSFGTRFSVHVEETDDTPGHLQTNSTEAFIRDKNDSAVITFNRLRVRRIRITVTEFHTWPCFRFMVKGFMPHDTIPVKNLRRPEIHFQYVNDMNMTLTCTANNKPVPGIKYTFTIHWKNTVLWKQITTDPLPYEQKVFVEDIFSGQLRCSLKACYDFDCQNTTSREVTSLPFKQQIIVLNKEKITVNEGDEAGIIHAKSNVPPHFFCLLVGKPLFCDVRLHITANTSKQCVNGMGIHPVVFGPKNNLHVRSPCSIPITVDNWRETLHIPVYGAINGVLGPQPETNVTLTIIAGHVPIPTISVSVPVFKNNTMKNAICRSLSGTHITTFDGSYYSNYLEGEYVFYKHKTLPYSINTYYRKCNQYTACMCGVAVRSFDNVILIDKCGTHLPENVNWPLTVKLYQSGEWQQGFTIESFEEGKHYKVYFPLGGVLSVRACNRKFLNIWFYPSFYDYMNSTGLCSSFDDNNFNDLTPNHQNYSGNINNFTMHWRVPANESLFTGICSNHSTLLQDDVFCACGSHNSSCKMMGKIRTCHRKENNMTTKLTKQRHEPYNCYDKVSEINQFKYNTSFNSVTLPSWSFNTYTEEAARTYCENYVKEKPEYDLCKSYVKMNMSSDIEGCVADIQITNSLQVASILLESFIEECKMNLERMPHTWINGKFPSAIINGLCPSSCSFQGECIKGKCECRRPFAGVDCSVNMTAVPTIIHLQNNGTCYNLTNKCDMVSVFGGPFIENTTRCHITQIKVTSKGNEKLKPVITQALLKSFSEVHCELPSSGHFQIEVSNNISILSNPKMFVSYNPLCYTCNPEDLTCVPTNNSCVIDGKCYWAHQTNPDLELEICDPNQSQGNWTKAPVQCSSSDRIWTTHNNKIIAFHDNNITENVKDVENCKKLCLEESSFWCRSIEYNNLNKECHLSKYRASDVGTYFLSTEGPWQYLDWYCPKDFCNNTKQEFKEWKSTVLTDTTAVKN